MPLTPSEPPSEDGENGAEPEREWMEIHGKAAGQTTIRSDSPIPNMMRSRSFRAAAATARTLSRLIVTSATMIIQIASHRDAPPLTSDSTPDSDCTSLKAI